MSGLKVLIAGAGLGGLTLAQSLCRCGIDCHLFERDHGPFDRPQGYRLHLDWDGLQALREVLAPPMQAVFEATAQFTEPYTTILDINLSVVRRILTHEKIHDSTWPEHATRVEHANVDRATLRQILLAGLDRRISFGKGLDRYVTTKHGVIAHFSDGSSVEGDLLVGADGIRSAVRAQRAPHAQAVDAGISAIYGRLPLRTAERLVPTETLRDIFTIASDDRKAFLGLGSVRFPIRPEAAAARFAPGISMQPQEDYVVCIVGGRHEFFPAQLQTATSTDLQRIAAETLVTWPRRSTSVIEACDPSAFFSVSMFTSVPCALDAPSNVTLLGDAIHAMTPTLGRGANLAMRDGVLLGRALNRVAAGERGLAEALNSYETNMLNYGFGVVREAAATGVQRMAQNPLPN